MTTVIIFWWPLLLVITNPASSVQHQSTSLKRDPVVHPDFSHIINPTKHNQDNPQPTTLISTNRYNVQFVSPWHWMNTFSCGRMLKWKTRRGCVINILVQMFGPNPGVQVTTFLYQYLVSNQAWLILYFHIVTLYNSTSVSWEIKVEKSHTLTFLCNMKVDFCWLQEICFVMSCTLMYMFGQLCKCRRAYLAPQI